MFHFGGMAQRKGDAPATIGGGGISSQIHCFSSLVATIRKNRPELLHDVEMHDAQPIPEQIPNQRLLEKHHVPIIEDIGQPTTACFFTKNTIEPMKWFAPSLCTFQFQY
jgi:hypothetical protein